MNEYSVSLLQQLGLSPKAITIYLANLELGTATVGEVAEKAKINRTTIYHILPELKSSGLITEIESGNKNFLVPENPSQLYKLATQKTQVAHQFADKVSAVVPELMSIFNLPAKKPRIKFYEGVEGLEKIYDDTLIGDHDAIYAFSDYEKMLMAMSDNFIKEYPKRRTEKGIKFYCISAPGECANKLSLLDKEQKREMKIVPNIKFDTEINIYGDKVALMSFVRPQMGVIIENRAIAQTLKTTWKAWWDSLK